MSPPPHPHPNNPVPHRNLDGVTVLILRTALAGSCFFFVLNFVKISAKVCNLLGRQVSKLKVTEEHNSFKEDKWFWLSFSAHHQIMLNM